MLGFSAMANAFIRHVYSFVGGMAALAGLAGISPDTFDQIVKAIHQVGDGTSSILAGVGTLISIGSALYARFTAKPAQQVAAVVNTVPGVTVVPDGTAPVPVEVAAKLPNS